MRASALVWPFMHTHTRSLRPLGPRMASPPAGAGTPTGLRVTPCGVSVRAASASSVSIARAMPGRVAGVSTATPRRDCT